MKKAQFNLTADTQFSTDWLQNAIVAEWIKRRMQFGMDTASSHLKLATSNMAAFRKQISEMFPAAVLVADKEKIGLYVSDHILVMYETKTWSIDVSILGGDWYSVDAYANALQENLNVTRSNIRWVYDDQYYETLTVPLNIKNYPIQEMYPFLGTEKLDDYFTRFIESESNILILIGPPGTGKTTFLRGLLDKTGSTATVTYSQKVMGKDAFFVDWLESESNILVMEDSDEMLMPRTDGNVMMHRFLNLGDGLITIPGKKLIFSTNLSSTSDIDSALTRPGRCFDILHFSTLRGAEIERLCVALGIEVPDVEEATLGELFEHNKQRHTTKKKKSFGFT